MEVPVPEHQRLDEYWSWVTVALFLLLTVDLLTTLFASGVSGVQAEANPIVRWALVNGTVYLVAVNLGALLVLAVLFYGLIRLTREAPEPYNDVVAASFEVWVGLLVATGLIIFANNLLVIVFRRDVFSLLAGLV